MSIRSLAEKPEISALANSVSVPWNVTPKPPASDSTSAPDAALSTSPGASACSTVCPPAACSYGSIRAISQTWRR